MTLTDKQRRIGAQRPRPPDELVAGETTRPILAPARDLRDWVEASILDDAGPLRNGDHDHLQDADLVFLWASTGFQRQQRTVLGQCEQLMFRAGGWQRARQEQQFIEWFGHVPQFVITLAADYCATCTDAEFCALVEHELYHIAHLSDEFGSPAFTKEGYPKLGIQGHDVEEFVGVVARYGPTPAVRSLVHAAQAQPEVGLARLTQACGTCLKAAA